MQILGGVRRFLDFSGFDNLATALPDPATAAKDSYEILRKAFLPRQKGGLILRGIRQRWMVAGRPRANFERVRTILRALGRGPPTVAVGLSADPPERMAYPC